MSDDAKLNAISVGGDLDEQGGVDLVCNCLGCA